MKSFCESITLDKLVKRPIERWLSNIHTMTLAIFDLDNTSLSGDSDHGWGNFLIRKKTSWMEKTIGELTKSFISNTNKEALAKYKYSAFSFTRLAEHLTGELKVLREEFMETVILPIIGIKARALAELHKRLTMACYFKYLQGRLLFVWRLCGLQANIYLLF